MFLVGPLAQLVERHAYTVDVIGSSPVGPTNRYPRIKRNSGCAGIIFLMDLSEFTPPARKSLTDEEISQRLGASTADEAGMLAAMDFLEEQTKLRDEDNRATEAWISKMKQSSDSRAAIALENLDRAKRGLEPLPLIETAPVVPAAPVVPEYPIFNAPTPVIETSPETVPEPVVEAIEPVVESLVEPEPLTVFGAEEAAEVFEEELKVDESIPAPTVRGFRLVSAANWIIGVGVVVPAVAASLAAVSGLNFVTSVLAGLVGVLVGVMVNVLGLITARRTKRGLAVASRATYGVFGAIVPGILVLAVGVTTLAAITFAGAKYLNNTIVGLPAFQDTVFTLGSLEVKFEAIAVFVLVVLAGVLAIFGGSFARWLKISLGAVLLLSFVALAIVTIPSIDYLNLAGVFQLDKFLLAAPLFALLMSVFSYGLDGESVAAASWGARTKTLTWPIFVFGFLLPLLTYGHMAALLNGHSYKGPDQVIEFLLSIGGEFAPTVVVDAAIIGIIALLFVGVSKLIEALKTLGTNHIGFGLASIVSVVFILVVILESLFVQNALGLNISISGLLLVPAAAWVGAVLTETIMRRGAYHDASLTRSYGFYGSVNWVAAIGFVLSVVAGFSVSEDFGGFTWFGFLSESTNISVSIVLAALIAMAISALFTLATGFPRILRQQRETKLVEDRRFDLVDVVVD